MSENIQNSTCEFAEELVSYLYDEMSRADKSSFENHLKDCSPCRDDLADFSLARTSIQEWRDDEFAPLPTPAIEIPYPKQAETSSRSWFATIREYFTLSPAWMTASTAFAALAICLGLVAVVVSSLKDDKVVQQTESKKIIPSPAIGNQNSAVSDTNQNKQTTDKLPQPPVTTDAPKPVKSENEPIKVSAPNLTKPNNSPVKTMQPKSTNKTVKQPVKTQKQKAPSFLDEEDEDDSLTLTDLLEEIGTREIDD